MVSDLKKEFNRDIWKLERAIADNQLAMREKYRDMMEYAYPCMETMKNGGRNALCFDMRRKISDTYDRIYSLADVDNNLDRMARVRDADRGQKQVQDYILLCLRLGLFDKKRNKDRHQYNEWSRRLAEVGRIIGGVIRDTKSLIALQEAEGRKLPPSR